MATKKRDFATLHQIKKKLPDDTVISTITRKKKLKINDCHDNQKEVISPAMERAEQIQANLSPKFPTMVKLMRPSHVTGGFWLGLTRQFCDMHMPSEDSEMILINEKGEEFKTKYLAAKVGLSGGWRGFSIVHNLIEGDAIVFQMVKSTKLKVYIVRSKCPNEASITKMNHDTKILEKRPKPKDKDAQDTRKTKKQSEPPQNQVQIDSQLALDKCENESDDLDSEVIESLRLSDSTINFKEIKNLDNFTVSINGLIIDSELSKHVLTKYYDLCCSQKSFLHENLLQGLNCKLVAGIISETVNISDAIKATKKGTSSKDFQIWCKTLMAFKDMGMNVRFLREKLEKLINLGTNLQIVVQHEVDAPWLLNDSDESVNGSEISPVLDIDDLPRYLYSKKSKQFNHGRSAIPVGIKFQANVAEWTETNYNGDRENLRWLNHKIRPRKGQKTRISSHKIGSGRPDSCSCISPGSSDCVGLHLSVKRCDLLAEIGSSFLTWRFNEMGEDAISQSWTEEEEKSFSLLRKSSNFWNEVIKCFPNKDRKSILSYYYNVYIPRRLSIETKTSCEEVDSDDDLVDDDDGDRKDFRKIYRSGIDGSRNIRLLHGTS